MKYFALAAACAALLRAQAPQQSTFSTLSDDAVVATTDGGKQPITAGEIRAILKSGDPKMATLFKQNPDQFLGTISQMKYLASEGEKAHLADQSPWKEQLEDFRNRVNVNAEINYVFNGYFVPAKDVDEYYAQNQSRFEQAWIKVIVLGFCPAAPKATGTSIEAMKEATEAIIAHDNCAAKRDEEQGLAEATKLVARIRGGEDFIKLVKQYSEDDDSKATDGDFGLVTRDNSFKPEIKAAVFALKDGEVSDPIRSGASFYIIKIKEKTVQPLSSVRDSIVHDLKQKHFNEWTEGINKRFRPVIEHPEFFTAPGESKPASPQK